MCAANVASLQDFVCNLLNQRSAYTGGARELFRAFFDNGWGVALLKELCFDLLPIQREVIRDSFAQWQEAIATPVNACRFVVKTGMHVRTFRVLNSCLSFDVAGRRINICGVSVPRLFCPVRDFDICWRSMYQQLNLIPVTVDGKFARCWSLLSCIDYFLSRAPYTAILQIPDNTLTVLLRCDAFPIAGGAWTVLCATLLEFGAYSRILACNPVIGLASVSLDKENLLFRSLFAPIVAECNHLLRLGTVTVGGHVYRVRLITGGDETMLRTVLGLSSVRSRWRSIYTLSFARDESGRKIPRTPLLYATWGGTGFFGQDNVPLWPVADVKHFVVCYLHMLMAFGRQLASALWHSASLSGTVAETADTLQALSVRFPFAKGPRFGAFRGVTGGDAWDMFTYFPSVAFVAGCSADTRAAVKSMYNVLSVLSIPLFDTLQKRMARADCVRSLPTVCNAFQRFVCTDYDPAGGIAAERRPLYLQYLEDAVPGLLAYWQPFGIAMFSQATCESLNCRIKKCYAAFSNRSEDSVTQVMHRLFMEIETYISPDCGPAARLPVRDFERRILRR